MYKLIIIKLGQSLIINNHLKSKSSYPQKKKKKKNSSEMGDEINENRYGETSLYNYSNS